MISIRIHGFDWISLDLLGFRWIWLDFLAFGWISADLSGWPLGWQAAGRDGARWAGWRAGGLAGQPAGPGNPLFSAYADLWKWKNGKFGGLRVELLGGPAATFPRTPSLRGGHAGVTDTYENFHMGVKGEG